LGVHYDVAQSPEDRHNEGRPRRGRVDLRIDLLRPMGAAAGNVIPTEILRRRAIREPDFEEPHFGMLAQADFRHPP
jgi:hypothetical protein